MRIATLLLGLLSSAAAAQDSLAVDARGQAAAGLVFAGTLGDAEVRELLRRSNVLPYAVYLSGPMSGGFHEVPPEQASLGVITEARRRTTENAATWPCLLISRERQMRQAEPHVRPAPGEPDLISRLRLTEIERARSASERVLRGELAIYSVAVIGRAEDVRSLAADRRVRELIPGQLVQNGPRREFVVRGMRPSREELPRIAPEIEALSAEEARARLEQVLRDPPPQCREVLLNTEMGGPAVRPEAVAGQPGTYTAAGLVFRGESRVGRSVRRWAQALEPQTPSHVSATVRVTNRSPEPVRRRIRGCTTILRVYRVHVPAGPPAWDQARGQCMDAPMELSLAPGESRIFQENASVSHILGDSLPSGRYAVTVLFRLADRTLEIPAGEVSLSHGVEGLAFRASTELTGGELRVTGAATNTTTRPIHIEFGACALVLRAHRRPDRSDRAVWDSRERAPWAGTYAYGCPLYLATRTVAPGETIRPGEFAGRFPLIEVLGDSLADGRYYFSASLTINHTLTPEFPAGSAVLSLPRPPLPASRTADLVTYRATTVPDPEPPGTLWTSVTATLTHAGGSRLLYSLDCPVSLYAYRSRARRDAAPRSGAPDWRSPQRCGPQLQEMWLQRGESRTFRLHTNARDILGERLPPGRYYFVAVVRAERRTVYVSAGEADLTR